MTKKCWWLGVVALVLVALAAPVGAAEVKIGIVDVQEVIFNSAEGKRAQETLKRKGEELGRDLERRQSELKRQIEEFQKQAAVMKEDARKKKEEEFGRKEMELRQKIGASQQEMAKLEEKELKPLYEKFARVIEQVSKDGKYTVIFDKRMVVGFDPAVDITDKVKTAFGR